MHCPDTHSVFATAGRKVSDVQFCTREWIFALLIEEMDIGHDDQQDVRRDLAKRMKFVPPDFRAGEFFSGKKIQAKSSKDGNLANGWWLKFLRSTFKQISRRPSDFVDLEDLRAWPSFEGQRCLGMFSDNSHMRTSLERQGLLVATKKGEKYTPQLLQGFWFKLKKKNPKIVAMSAMLLRSYKQQEVFWKHCH